MSYKDYSNKRMIILKGHILIKGSLILQEKAYLVRNQRVRNLYLALNKNPIKKYLNQIFRMIASIMVIVLNLFQWQKLPIIIVLYF